MSKKVTGIRRHFYTLDIQTIETYFSAQHIPFLGGLIWIDDLPNESAMDDIVKNCISYFQNRLVVTFVHGRNNNYRAQFTFYDSGDVKFRNRTGTVGWKAWKTIQMT